MLLRYISSNRDLAYFLLTYLARVNTAFFFTERNFSISEVIC